VTFVAGDDDQSIYSFRFALPAGIQTFRDKYPDSGDHSLETCFRCAVAILDAAQAVVEQHPSHNRIPKHLVSAYAESDPPVQGRVLRWRYQNGLEEARAIASSCQALIAAGLKPDEILILLSDRNILEGPIARALGDAQVPFESRNELDHLASDQGRILYDVLRIISNPDDYIAHRSLLGLLRNVGIGTCVGIKNKVVENNLNYKALFYQPLPEDVFTPRQTSAIDRLRAVCGMLADWEPDDTLAERKAALAAVADHFGEHVRTALEDFFETLPEAMTLAELRQLLATQSDQVADALVAAVYERMGVERQAGQEEEAKVRVMTMHGAKGLSARVVFVAGLEEQVFPGPRRRPYPGLIEEATRLFYVSVTRTRAACILSYARRRVVHGQSTQHSPSRFNNATGGAFADREGGLTPELAQEILADCELL
jgi:DNA helicase-2/ATP-dependent DNA helicase PcrA